MTIKPERLKQITSAVEDGINGYGVQSGQTYCAMLNELLAERKESEAAFNGLSDTFRASCQTVWDALGGSQFNYEKQGLAEKAKNVADERDLGKQFQAELWGLLCPDAGPDDRQAIIDSVKALLQQQKELSYWKDSRSHLNDGQPTKVGETNDATGTAGGQDRGAEGRAGQGESGRHPTAGQREGTPAAGQGAVGGAGQAEQRG